MHDDEGRLAGAWRLSGCRGGNDESPPSLPNPAPRFFPGREVLARWPFGKPFLPTWHVPPRHHSARWWPPSRRRSPAWRSSRARAPRVPTRRARRRGSRASARRSRPATWTSSRSWTTSSPRPTTAVRAGALRCGERHLHPLQKPTFAPLPLSPFSWSFLRRGPPQLPCCSSGACAAPPSLALLPSAVTTPLSGRPRQQQSSLFLSPRSS